jgi:hypothetical protein
MSENRKINCSIRCLDQSIVVEVRTGLTKAPISSVPYVCKVSGQKEEVLLVSDELAETISDQVIGLLDSLDAILAVATLYTQLCECDLATLAQKPEADVLAHLDRLEEAGVLTRQLIDGMNYFGIATGRTRDEISTRLSPYLNDL